jgi:endonuclease YncB( thermonuclease family)
MDGRYLQETVQGNFGGETFLGQAILGYDNVSKKFFSVWIDTMCTGKMDAVGTFNPTNKTFSYTTEMNCPMTGKQQNGRTIERWVDNDTFVMEMYGPWFKTGKEFKMMEITFKRAK